MRDNEVEIIENEIKEFVFDNYSIIYDDGIYALKYYDEEYGEAEIEIDEKFFEEEKEIIDSIKFNVEDLNKVKEFIFNEVC